MKIKITALILAVAVVACGGGGGDTGNSQPPVGIYTPTATVLAARQTNYATPYWNVFNPALLPPGTVYNTSANGSCLGLDMSTTVYVLPNTITYAASGVSELSQQQAAEYSEKAITEIKATLGLASSTGYTGQRLQICAQGRPLFGFAQGAGNKRGFEVQSSDSSSLDRGFLINDFDLYKRLVKHELAHTYHQAALGTDDGVLDVWFAEGLAEYIASGKSTKSKAEILSLVNTKNPVDITTSGTVSGSSYFSNYPAYQSVVAYLFDPNGAKNNLTMLPSFLADLKVKYNTPIPPCMSYPCSIYKRDYAWDPAFEQHFKEPNGTAMKIRTGTNNLRDTVATRLNNFLP